MAFYFALLKTSMKASMSNRGAFLIESSLMIANNLIFFSIWWIFFRQFNNVAGWNFQDMIVLIAIGTGSYGLTQIFFGGIRNLSKMIINGDLDPFMTQPKNLLIHVSGSKSFSKGWGHLATAILLISFSGLLSWQNLALMTISLLSGMLVIASFTIIAHSLSFWMGSIEGIAKKYCDALFLFSLYPTNIYSGLLQVVMFTLIPAGIITYIPVELVRSFTWEKLFILLGSATGFVILAYFVFYAGLKRYESGNKFGIR